MKDDALTKATTDAFKVAATYLERRTLVVRFNHDFVSARKQQTTAQGEGAAGAKLFNSELT